MSHITRHRATSPNAGKFMFAWLLTKFTEPVRAVATAAVTPTVARALGRAPAKEKK